MPVRDVGKQCHLPYSFFVLLLTITIVASAQADLPELSTFAEVASVSTTGSSSPTSPSTSPADTLASFSAASEDLSSAASAPSMGATLAVTTSAMTSTTVDATSITVLSTFAGLSNVPTLVGVGAPPLVIPDTSRAPFMQKSSLPEGTVFICVGAALGFFGMSVLAWRGLVAWSLHRSVKRAAQTQYASETKSAHRSGFTGAYDTPHETLSLDQFSTPHKPHRQRRGSRNPPSSSLFFSPTAGAGVGMQHMASNRSSAFLPSGYYAAGSAAPAAGAAVAHFGGPPTGAGRASDEKSTRPHTASERDAAGSLLVPERRSQLGVTGAGKSKLTMPSAQLDDLFERRRTRLQEGRLT